MKPLAKCVNGCDAPPQPPSKVLCANCFMKLDDRFTLLLRLAETEAALRAVVASLRGIAKWAEPPAYLPDAGVWALYRVDKEAASDALALPAVRRVMESKG